MLLVAMPAQALSIHGSVPKAVAIAMAEAAPFVLSTILALAIGLGRVPGATFDSLKLSGTGEDVGSCRAVRVTALIRRAGAYRWAGLYELTGP